MPASTPKRKRKAASRKPARRKAKKSQPRLLVRTSERSTHSRCPWQWQWGYNDRYSPRREQPALKFGTLIHKALEVRYPKGIKRGPKPAETFEKLFKKEQKQAEAKWNMKIDGEWEDMLAVGIDMMEMYVEKYGRDEDWRVIESEMTFQVPVYLPANALEIYPLARGLLSNGAITKRQAEGKDPLFWYVGTMDGVWENRMDGGVRINDYKTTSGDAEKEAQAKSVLDEQTTAYWTWGVDWLEEKKILKPRQLQALDGMLFSMLKKARRDTRPTNADGLYLNQDGTISKKQPAKVFHRELVYRSEIEQQRARDRAVQEVMVMIAMRSGLLPITKSPGTGYPSQQCNACSFRDMCELHEGGGDWELAARATMERWDPYSDHEIAEEGKR